MPGFAPHWIFKPPVDSDELLIVLEFEFTCVSGERFEEDAEDAVVSIGLFETLMISDDLPSNLLDLFWL